MMIIKNIKLFLLGFILLTTNACISIPPEDWNSGVHVSYKHKHKHTKKYKPWHKKKHHHVTHHYRHKKPKVKIVKYRKPKANKVTKYKKIKWDKIVKYKEPKKKKKKKAKSKNKENYVSKYSLFSDGY